MAKLGIYVPDGKMAEIEEWRKEINFSQLFIEAFDREMRVQSIIKTVLEKSDMKATIVRLQQCRTHDYAAGCELGAEDGTTWATGEAPLADLRQICTGEVKDGNELFQLLDNADAWDAERFREHTAGHDEKAFLAGYYSGFVKGAKAVWTKVSRAF
jgi:hypothetical protein